MDSVAARDMFAKTVEHARHLAINREAENGDENDHHVSIEERTMKKVIVLMLAGLTLAGCTQTEKGATIGAAGGAIIGGAVSNSWRGAAIGAAVGGVTGALVGHVSEQPGQCYYRDRYGRRYIDDCPRSYRRY